MKKYLFAVSGGPDSMAMLDMYHKKAQAVCVVNYHKRKSADFDVQCVVDYCTLHNIKYYVYNVDKKIYKSAKNENFQVLAREIRYDFFQKVAKKEKNSNLMVAHNLNDHLESAFMQKNKHSRALFYGIKKNSTYKNLSIYRPLLGLQKSTLERYCKKNGIKYGVDESNAMDIYERNRVRKIINSWDSEQFYQFMVEIRKYNKSNRKLSKKVDKTFKKWVESQFNLEFFRKIQDPDIKYYMVYNFLSLHDETNNSKNKILEIIKYLEKPSGKEMYRLEKGKKLKKQNKCLAIVK